MAHITSYSEVECGKYPRFCGQQCRKDVTIGDTNDLVLYGKIKDCSGRPVQGAVVKIFYKKGCELVGISHTYTGENGMYLISIPSKVDGVCIEGKELVVIASKSSCHNPKPCKPHKTGRPGRSYQASESEEFEDVEDYESYSGEIEEDEELDNEDYLEADSYSKVEEVTGHYKDIVENNLSI